MTDWHAADDHLAAFRDGSLGPVAAASVETHVVECEVCRSKLRTLGPVGAEDGRRRERMWSAIADRIDQPTRNWHGHRWLQATVGTPSLFLATVAVVLALLAVPVAASLGNPRVATAILFALAPLAPVLGVVLAFRSETDPAGELGAAAPLVSLRLVLMRAAVVLGVAIPAGLATSALLPLPFPLVLGWLLPGLGLCAVVLAAAALVEPTRLASVLAIGWAAAVAAAFAGTRRVPLESALEQIFVNQTVTQTLFGVVAVVAAGLVFVRRAEIRPWSAS